MHMTHSYERTPHAQALHDVVNLTHAISTYTCMRKAIFVLAPVRVCDCMYVCMYYVYMPTRLYVRTHHAQALQTLIRAHVYAYDTFI